MNRNHWTLVFIFVGILGMLEYWGGYGRALVGFNVNVLQPNKPVTPTEDSCMVLIVCAGNTCRSPMGEQILRGKLAKQLGCSEDQLAERGYVIQSAGIEATPGGRASGRAQRVMKSMGMDLRKHLSRPVSDPLVNQADLILTMSSRHQRNLLAKWPEAADRTFLFAVDKLDVADPLGRSKEIYQECADQLVADAAYWANRVVVDKVMHGDVRGETSH